MDLSFMETHKQYMIGITAIFGVLITLYGLRRFILGPACSSKVRLDGKVVIITGANTGIGKETAVNLARRGATVIVGCRNKSRGTKAVSEIRERSRNINIFFKALDLASLQSVKDFAASFLKEFDRLDILINNAGVMMCPYSKTKDGFEMQLGTNHLGHFGLTMLLLERLKQSNGSRIVNLSSAGHKYTNKINFDDINAEKSYGPIINYAQSKLANILFTRELARKIKETGMSTFSVHPGVVDTELNRHSFLLKLVAYLTFNMFFKTPEQGAQTSIYCAVEKDLETKNGEYFADCRQVKSSPASYDEGVAKKLWEISEDMTGIKFPL